MASHFTMVASRTEAWIETFGVTGVAIADDVASRTEAWIETTGGRAGYSAAQSPPARRRGLKQVEIAEVVEGAIVASRTEAWIETILGSSAPRGPGVASRTEAWIETWAMFTKIAGTSCRLPHGGVD